MSVLAIPAPPSDLYTESSECFGHYWVSWDYSDGATYYELYRLTPTVRVIYSGIDVALGVNIGSQSTTLAVKACNSEGCSALGPSKFVSPWSTCN